MPKKVKRKQPITKEVIAGILVSAEIVNERANARQDQEQAKFGRVEHDPHVPEEITDAMQLPEGASPQVINLTGGHSIGMHQSARVLLGLAAELALKFAYEQENPDASAANTHDLFDLYHKLSKKRMDKIEADYSLRTRQHQNIQAAGWQTAGGVFTAARNYFTDWRYVSEGRIIPFFQPLLLVEAVCSVCKTLGMNITRGDDN